jgi:tripartite-type tricarboxylate transporter receptor subunit TctC
MRNGAQCAGEDFVSTNRFWLRLIAVCCLLSGLPAIGWAQSYPDRVVRYIATDGPGSGADVLARIVAAGLAEEFGHQVIVDNRPGFAGNIGMEVGAKAAPDGYTYVQMSSTHAINVSLYRDLRYDLLRDFDPVTQLSWIPAVVVVHPSLPVQSIGELVTLAKRRPGTLNYSSIGVGSTPFLATELFKTMTGTKVEHVGYKGAAEALTAVISGEVSIYFPPIGPALPQVQHGKVRALAVTSVQRSPMLPNIPTVAEAGVPGYESIIWHGILVPAKTPGDIIARIHQATTSVLGKPAYTKRLNDLGYVMVGSSPKEFASHIRNNIALQAKVLKDAGVSKPY